MSLLAIDHGTRRIGLARTGPMDFILPLPILEVDDGDDPLGPDVIDQVVAIVENHEIGEVVVGHPLWRGRDDNTSAYRCEEFARRLQVALGEEFPVHLQDEGLSSWEAEGALRATGDKRVAKARIDTMAARVILQDFLSARGSPPPAPSEEMPGTPQVRDKQRRRRRLDRRKRD